MDKIFVVMAVEDQQYQEAVLAYIRGSDYRNKLIVRFFSSKDRVAEWTLSGEPVHILMATPGLMPEKQQADTCAVILLAGDELPDAASHVLHMYQPLNKLFASALEQYAQLNPNAAQRFQRDRKTKIASIYSSVGGAGKTAVALAAAHQLSQRGFTVLYLNMEAVSGEPLHPAGVHEEGLSNLLYYMRNNEKQLPARYETLKKHHDGLKIDYITGPSNVRDLLEITELDTRRLLQALAHIGLYEYIVVDMDSTVQERNLGILQESDFVYWIMQKDEQCRAKTDTTMKFLKKANLSERQFFDNIFFVMNKQLDEKENVREGKPFTAALPYIPEWKWKRDIASYAENRHFNHYVRHMLAVSRLLVT